MYAVAAIGLLLTGWVSACGGANSETTPPPAASNVVTAAEIEKYPPGSVQRSFLNYWSDLQFQSWADVAAYYDPALRKLIQTPRLISAKRPNASTYVLLKPTVTRVKDEGGMTTLYYSVRLADGTQELASTAWKKIGGNWEIVYDSRLDAELSQLARNQVEIEKHGGLPTDPSQPLSAAATRAGEKAAQLQARFLEQELHAPRP